MHDFNGDPYEVLGIRRDATQREVKQTYRQLALKFHPDHNPEKPEAAERFKKIQWAYECLSGRKKRRRSTPVNFYHGNYPPSFFKNEHPFFSFYWAMKIHGNRRMKNSKLYRQDENEKPKAE
jgi:DnaJ-class molecular chaperone